MTERKETTWCTFCGARFTHAEVDSAQCCPKCNDEGVPCDPNDDVIVGINWHELRILAIWAENWAQHCQTRNPGGRGEARPEIIQAIAGRLTRQCPGKNPLTLSGEIMQIKEHGYGIESYGIAKTMPIPIHGRGAMPLPAPPAKDAASERIAKARAALAKARKQEG